MAEFVICLPPVAPVGMGSIHTTQPCQYDVCPTQHTTYFVWKFHSKEKPFPVVDINQHKLLQLVRDERTRCYSLMSDANLLRPLVPRTVNSHSFADLHYSLHIKHPHEKLIDIHNGTASSQQQDASHSFGTYSTQLKVGSLGPYRSCGTASGASTW
jgi:hypothetical protein